MQKRKTELTGTTYCIHLLKEYGKFHILGFMIIGIALMTASCKQESMKYDKSMWIKLDESQSNELREKMVDDLRKNHSPIGMKFKNIIEELGEPNVIDSVPVLKIVYTMTTTWKGIEPVSGSEYWIYLNADSSSKSDSIYYWKKHND